MSLLERETTKGLGQVVGKSGRFSSLEKRLPGWVRRMDRGILALLIVFALTLPLFTPRIYASDEIKYFSYLHSVFFDGDVDFTNEYTYFYESNPKKYAYFKDSVLNKLNEKGLPVNEGPVGSALLWTPFYGVAHGAALLGNAIGLKSFKPDGFSAPYVWAVTLASLLYGFAGLIFSYLFACNFLPRFYAAFATIVIWLASPVIFYLSLTPPMSHANSLFLISLWLWLWYRTREWDFDEQGHFKPGIRRGSMWLLLGVLGGLMTMVREQDGVVLIIAAVESLYLFWVLGVRGRVPGQQSKAASSSDQSEATNPLKNENFIYSTYMKNSEKEGLVAAATTKPLFTLHSSLFTLIIRNIIFLLGLFLGLLPQLIVYLALNGRIGPGRTVGDKLQFLNPEVPGRFLGLLFLNPDHALLWWSPVLLPALVGLVMLLRVRQWRLVTVALLAAFVAEVYISASFQTWTMRGSFGPRRLVGISPLYILGLGYLARWLVQQKRGWKLPRRALVAIAALFIVWNFGLIIQFSVIRTEESRQRLDPARVVVDQFTVVPGRLVDTGLKFFSNRDKLYKT